MPLDVLVFLSSPDLADNFKTLKKDDLRLLAEHFQIPVRPNMKKTELKTLVKNKLIEDGLLEKEIEDDTTDLNTKGNNFQLQLELKKLELQEKEKERQMQFEMQEKEMQEKEKERQMQLELKKLELEKEFELEKLRIQQGVSLQSVRNSNKQNHSFDASRNIRLVPKFIEKSVDKYFPQFEKVAENLKWPKPTWTTLLQSVLVGKAAEVYSAMSLTDSSDYEHVKQAILKAYELVPEAYRQKFRNYKKFDRQTYVEFSREQEDLFDQWLRAKNIKEFDSLRELMLIEQFKNCLFTDLRTHLDDKEVKTLNEAAVLSDSYALTHKRNFMKPSPRHFNDNSSNYKNYSNSSQSQLVSTHNNNNDDKAKLSQLKSKSNQSHDRDSSAADTVSGRSNNFNRASPAIIRCGYCKQTNHTIDNCFKLKKKNEMSDKPIGLLSHNGQVKHKKQETLSSSEKIMEDYKPYLSNGSITLDEHSSPVPIQILRDTGASQTLLLDGVLPLSEKTATGKSVLLQVVHLGTFKVPLHLINLKSNFISGPVVVGVSPTLPVKGISLLLGNDLASGKDILSPIVSENTLVGEKSDAEDKKIFPACVVTRAMAKRKTTEDDIGNDIYNLSDTFFNVVEEKVIKFLCQLKIKKRKLSADNN